MPKLNARNPSLTSQESYSAVIIADLVADVPVVPEKVEEKQTAKEKTNFGYDNHMDDELNNAVNKKPSKESIALSAIKNETGITKGVILNAVQFGHPEFNNKLDEKPMKLTNSLTVQDITRPVAEETRGFKDMSYPRKVAFVFSFLPSILFVLCFAVILPCNVLKPCIETKWIRTFNNAEITSNIEINNNIVFIIFENNATFLMELQAEKGTVERKEGVSEKAVYVKCGTIINKSGRVCAVVDETGKIQVFNSSNEGFLLDPTMQEIHSLPIILPDCNDDGIDEIAFVASNTEIKVIYSDNNVSQFEISNCDSTPSKLFPWTTNGTTDIVIFCKDGKRDKIMKIPQNKWCDFDKQSEGSTWTLHPKVDSEKELIIHPTEEGLVLWSGNNISMLLPDGSEAWNVFNDSHSDENRFILHGRFNGKKEEIALLSSDTSSKLEITILNSENGSAIKSVSIPFTEATEVIKIQGRERDFTILLLKTVKKDAVTETLDRISDLSSTIVNYLSNEVVTNPTKLLASVTTEELAFLELDGTIHKIQEVKGTGNSQTLAVIQEKDLLNIYLHSKGTYPSKVTEISRIEVANWDVSVSKASECSLK